jgi:hypothetical protein
MLVLLICASFVEWKKLVKLRSYGFFLRTSSSENDLLLQIETTIYTTCGRCRKPLIVPAGSRIPGHVARGGFSYCISCKSSCAICAIWLVNHDCLAVHPSNLIPPPLVGSQCGHSCSTVRYVCTEATKHATAPSMPSGQWSTFPCPRYFPLPR